MYVCTRAYGLEPVLSIVVHPLNEASTPQAKTCSHSPGRPTTFAIWKLLCMYIIYTYMYKIICKEHAQGFLHTCICVHAHIHVQKENQGGQTSQYSLDSSFELVNPHRPGICKHLSGGGKPGRFHHVMLAACDVHAYSVIIMTHGEGTCSQVLNWWDSGKPSQQRVNVSHREKVNWYVEYRHLTLCRYTLATFYTVY